MVVDSRTWGDGGGKTRSHEVEVVSLDLGVVICAVDGDAVRFGDVPADIAWDIHRGVDGYATRRSVDAGTRATDAEVEEFLAWVAREEDGLPPTVSTGVMRANAAAAPPDNDGNIIEFLNLVREFQSQCTCDETDIFSCPNYRDGDEEAFDER